MPKGWLRIGAQTNNRRIREQGYASGRLVVVVHIAFVDIAAYFTPGARDGIGIVPPLELVTCSHVFSPQLPLNLTCKPLHPVIFSLFFSIHTFQPSRVFQH
jgi:hypothetical protein